MTPSLTCTVGFNLSHPGRFHRGRKTLTILQPGGSSLVFMGESQHIGLMENLLLTWGWEKGAENNES